jgi:hypothetical protein
MRTLSSRHTAIAGAIITVVVALAGSKLSIRHMPSTGLTASSAASEGFAVAPVPAVAPAPPTIDAIAQTAARRADRSASAKVRAGASLVANMAVTADASYWANQKLIRSGELRVLVKNVRRAIQLADSIGGRHGALLSGSRTSGDAQASHDAELQFRVPADRFTETVAALRTLGDVRNESMTTQDVTRDYADLETRLAVKTETVTRLRTLLATHTAKLGEVLQG